LPSRNLSVLQKYVNYDRKKFNNICPGFQLDDVELEEEASHGASTFLKKNFLKKEKKKKVERAKII
jgi:hypothetical protein